MVIGQADVAGGVVLAQQSTLLGEGLRQVRHRGARPERLVVAVVLEHDQEDVLDRGRLRAAFQRLGRLCRDQAGHEDGGKDQAREHPQAAAERGSAHEGQVRYALGRSLSGRLHW